MSVVGTYAIYMHGKKWHQVCILFSWFLMIYFLTVGGKVSRHNREWNSRPAIGHSGNTTKNPPSKPLPCLSLHILALNAVLRLVMNKKPSYFLLIIILCHISYQLAVIQLVAEKNFFTQRFVVLFTSLRKISSIELWTWFKKTFASLRFIFILFFSEWPMSFFQFLQDGIFFMLCDYNYVDTS